MEKLKWWGYICCKKETDEMYNRLDRISACDGQTDGRASCYGIDRVTLLKITYAYIDIDVIDLKVEFLQVCG